MTTKASPLFSVLRQSTAEPVVAALEALVHEGTDAQLNRVNPLAFAAAHGLAEDATIGGFLHAARAGAFDLSWNMLCPGCGGVLQSGMTLKSFDHTSYHCALCAAGYEPTLDEMVEVTFTVNPRVRRIAAHDPDSLPIWDYMRQVFWSSGTDIPTEGFEALMQEVVLDFVELPAGEKAVLSLHLPEAFVIVFDPVSHSTQFLDTRGPPTRERQVLDVVFNQAGVAKGTLPMRPGPLRLSLDNRTSARVLPGLWVAGDALHDLLGRRRPFLTAKRLLSNQTFRDLYRTDTISVDQRFKITSMTFLFTDLKGSTALYDQVGDLVAFDLVRAHFSVILDIVASEQGAVVKTIGDAVMATFPTPDRAVAAALRMREAMDELNRERGREDLLLHIGLHEGPCLAVVLNERQDYFGQTVNVASRVQHLARSRSIFTTAQVIGDPGVAGVLARAAIVPIPRAVDLRGVTDRMDLFEIP
jgi:class 3 adenylate cyclase